VPVSDLDALEHGLVEQPPRAVGGLAVGVGAAGGELDGEVDDLLPLAVVASRSASLSLAAVMSAPIRSCSVLSVRTSMASV